MKSGVSPCNKTNLSRRQAALLNVPGVVASSDDRRNDVRQSKLADGRDMFDDVVTEQHPLRDIVGDEGARVSGDDRDRLGRVDEVSGDVVIDVGRVRVDGV